MKAKNNATMSWWLGKSKVNFYRKRRRIMKLGQEIDSSNPANVILPFNFFYHDNCKRKNPTYDSPFSMNLKGIAVQSTQSSQLRWIFYRVWAYQHNQNQMVRRQNLRSLRGKSGLGLDWRSGHHSLCLLCGTGGLINGDVLLYWKRICDREIGWSNWLHYWRICSWTRWDKA